MYSAHERVEKLPYPITFLKQVLLDIIDTSPETNIRFRLVGDHWELGFLKVISVRHNGALMLDEKTRTMESIDLTDVMQFELDERLNGLEPFFYYDVSPASFA
jgi:hypothetical protein